MKKVLLSLCVVISSIALVSCNGNKNGENSAEASAEASVETSAAAETSISPEDFQSQLDEAIKAKDAARIQQLVGESQTTYNKLAATDKATAEAYLKKVQDAITAKAADIKAATGVEATSLISKIKQIPEDAVNAAQAAGDTVAKAAANAVKATADEAVSKAKSETVDKAKSKVKAASEEGKKKANEAVDKAHHKASDAVNKASQEAANAVNKALGR